MGAIADWLGARAAEGWQIEFLSDEFLTMTDAPDRVPPELDWPAGEQARGLVPGARNSGDQAREGA